MAHRRIAKHIKPGSPLPLEEIEQNLKTLRTSVLKAMDTAIAAVHARVRAEGAHARRRSAEEKPVPVNIAPVRKRRRRPAG